jgi:hypothetical protein
MKALKIGLTLFSMLVLVTFSSAQSGTERMTKEEARTERIIEYVGLDAATAVKARELSVKYTALFKEAGDDVKKEQIIKDMDVDAKNLLTEEQYKKYKEFLANEKNTKKARTERAKGAK